MGADTQTMTGAWELFDQILLDPRVSFLPEPIGMDRDFRSRSNLTSRSPKVWADAYLLSFAAAAGLKLITFDRALKVKDVDVLVL
jgi:predicted nucleic acid-binding protein